METYTDIKASCNQMQLLVEIEADESIDRSKIRILEQQDSSINIYAEPELTSAEETALATIVSNHVGATIGEENFLVKEYSNRNGGNLLKETWYHTDNGDGTYSDIVSEKEYAYYGNTLIEHIEREYWINGVVRNEKKYRYYIITKI